MWCGSRPCWHQPCLFAPTLPATQGFYQAGAPVGTIAALHLAVPMPAPALSFSQATDPAGSKRSEPARSPEGCSVPSALSKPKQPPPPPPSSPLPPPRLHGRHHRRQENHGRRAWACAICAGGHCSTSSRRSVLRADAPTCCWTLATHLSSMASSVQLHSMAGMRSHTVCSPACGGATCEPGVHACA